MRLESRLRMRMLEVAKMTTMAIAFIFCYWLSLQCRCRCCRFFTLLLNLKLLFLLRIVCLQLLLCLRCSGGFTGFFSLCSARLLVLQLLVRHRSAEVLVSFCSFIWGWLVYFSCWAETVFCLCDFQGDSPIYGALYMHCCNFFFFYFFKIHCCNIWIFNILKIDYFPKSGFNMIGKLCFKISYIKVTEI